MDLAAEWRDVLRAEAGGYAELALANIKREFPAGVHHVMAAPGDFPFRPRVRTPVFYGSYDWHSCVEMHWLLVRLLRTAADAVPADEIRVTLRGQFTPVALEAEAEYISGPGRWGQRPYGWGWALALVQEARLWDDQDGRKWAAALAPLAEAITGCFPVTRGWSRPWPPRGPTPAPPCRTSSATTTWWSTGSPATRSCCSADGQDRASGGGAGAGRRLGGPPVAVGVPVHRPTLGRPVPRTRSTLTPYPYPS